MFVKTGIDVVDFKNGSGSNLWISPPWITVNILGDSEPAPKQKTATASHSVIRPQCIGEGETIFKNFGKGGTNPIKILGGNLMGGTSTHSKRGEIFLEYKITRPFGGFLCTFNP